ncbi:MAG: PAS domain S-box protein [Desulfobacteraceae bacterium]|nr:PAS domain S-box protein [Desulfobacteraceae bacterium]
MEQTNTTLPKDYEGRLLFEDKSSYLKESLCSYINRLKSINEFLVPAILYISAWETGKNEIWYEYAGDNFKDLFSSDIKNLPSIFRSCVSDRKTYTRNQNNVTIHTQNRALLLKKKFTIRNETESSGFNEAVYKINHKNDTFWLKDQAFVIPFPNDQITISIGNLTNVTKEMEAEEERKKTEEKLKKKEKILRSLFNNSYDSVIVTDIEGNIIDCNEVAQKTFGLSRKEMLQKRYYDFIIPEEKKKVISEISEIIDKKNIRTEATIQKNDSTQTRVEVSIVRIDNEPPVVQAFIRDISQRIALEREKIKTSKFRLVSTMATGITHDINNILSIVLGNLSLAAIEASKTENQSILKIIERIENAATHLETMTKKFLKFSDISLIFKNQVEIEKFFLKFIEKYKDVSFRINTSDNLKYFNINVPIFEPAIDSVIENSVEAMEDLKEKIIEINISSQSIKESSDLKQKLIREGNYIKIQIKDFGRGIEPKNIERIFDPYFSTKPLSSKKGTGLGLTNAFTAIKQHNGFIEVKSKENIMTNFIIYIPE